MFNSDVHSPSRTIITPTSRNRKPSNMLLEKIEKRMAANQQQMVQILQQVKYVVAF